MAFFSSNDVQFLTTCVEQTGTAPGCDQEYAQAVIVKLKQYAEHHRWEIPASKELFDAIVTRHFEDDERSLIQASAMAQQQIFSRLYAEIEKLKERIADLEAEKASNHRRFEAIEAILRADGKLQ